jgi:hypothetical protein
MPIIGEGVGSGGSTSTARQFSLAARLPWRWLLPLIMCVITFGLSRIALRQGAEFGKAHPGFTDTPQELQEPADFLGEVLDGPGYYLTGWFDGEAGRLLGVAIFWFWLGWGLDRRLHGIRQPVIRSALARAVVYLLLLSLASAFTLAAFSEVHMHGPPFDPWTWRWVRAMGLRASILGAYVAVAWGAIYVVYFGRKCWGSIAALTPPR